MMDVSLMSLHMHPSQPSPFLLICTELWNLFIWLSEMYDQHMYTLRYDSCSYSDEPL